MDASVETGAPLACSLTADEAADRTSEFRALFAGTSAVVIREPLTLRLWYTNRPGLRAALSDLLRRERECCPFFTYDAVDESPRARLTLRVQDAAAEAWLDWFEAILVS